MRIVSPSRSPRPSRYRWLRAVAFSRPPDSPPVDVTEALAVPRGRRAITPGACNGVHLFHEQQEGLPSQRLVTGRFHALPAPNQNTGNAERAQEPEDSLPAGLIGRTYFRRENTSEILESNRCRRGCRPEQRSSGHRHLEGLPEDLCSGNPGGGREAIRATIANTMDEKGRLTFTVKPKGLVEAQTAIAHSGCRGSGPVMKRWMTSPTGRQWKLLGIGWGAAGADR